LQKPAQACSRLQKVADCGSVFVEFQFGAKGLKVKLREIR
jgi:hypothetical protein